MHDGPAYSVEKVLALKPSCENSWSSVFLWCRSKRLFRALVSPPVWHQRRKMSFNQWIDLPSWYTASENEQTWCRRQTYIFDEWAAKSLLAAKKLRCMILHYHIIIWERIFATIDAQSYRGAWHSARHTHLDPCHPVESRAFDIERHIRYWRLRYRMLIRYRRFAPSLSYFDIEGIRYRRSHCAISKFNNLRCRMSITGSLISRFHDFDIDSTHFDIACYYDHDNEASKCVCDDIVYNFEGHTDVRYRRSCHQISGSILDSI
jgi:hypothetical protein